GPAGFGQAVVQILADCGITGYDTTQVSECSTAFTLVPSMMVNNVWARKQPCLTLLEMGKLPDRDPLCFT
ncbi:hypothetical protein, partial [Thiolapillus sp.]|uniref:hypothetical protein n=1 Tax=Thiolapillus sp. TaxID=2017437 RepID=UPI0025CF049A